MSLKPKQKGYIYLIRTSTFRSLHKYIYKLGKSIDYSTRFNNYDKFGEIYVLYYVEDIDFIEDILIQIFKRKFTHEDMYGKEYFSGAINDMLQTMEHIINGYGFIEKKDLFNELIEDKLKRFIIYNDEYINPFIYEIINDYIDEHNIKKEDINDVTNYNQFYNTYIMNNKNLYNNGKSKKNVKEDEHKIKLKTTIENNDKIDNIIENELNENELNENELNGSELNRSEFNKNELKNKLLYICHNCLEYCTSNRKDLVRHLNRKYKCKNYITETNYEDAKILSLGKKFYFHFNIKDILIEDLNFITKNYNNEENHIYINYKLVIDNTNEEKDKNNIKEEGEDNIKEDGNLHNEFKKQFYNEKINKYVCNKCLSKFKSKRNIVKHIISGKKCEYIQKINKLIN